MFAQILTSFVLQIVLTVGIIFLFGFLIALCNKRFYSNFGTFGSLVCYITGAVGTPIHELSHALFCIIFGHKITEIKLFQINSSDGTLGYVNHTYNPKNIYHKIGNFFIGVAPIIVISAVMYLLAWLILPAMNNQIKECFAIVDFVDDIGKVFENILLIVKWFFMSARTWQWWVFLIVAMFLSLHMTLSKADIKGALSGIVFLLMAVFIVDLILGFVNMGALNAFTRCVMKAGSVMLCFFMLSIIISCIVLVISFIFKTIKNRCVKA